MSTLTEIMNKYGSDKGYVEGNGGYHGYSKVYETMFSPIKDEKLNVLEIGIGSIDPNAPCNMSIVKKSIPHYASGASIRAWKDYFVNSNIYAFDIDESTMIEGEDRITTFVCNQIDTHSLYNKFYDELKDVQFDIIIDDGLHDFFVNWYTFKVLYHKLKPGGIYVIEDVHNYSAYMIALDPFTKNILIPNDDKFEGVRIPDTAANSNLFIVRKGTKQN